MIDASTAELIEQLAARAAASQELPEARVAASLSGALPVHWDMGGILLLRADGEVLLYDDESETCEPVGDASWRTYAYVNAARKYPGLEHLMPERPSGAAACPQCHGTGRVFERYDCGVCSGTGWLVEASGGQT